MITLLGSCGGYFLFTLHKLGELKNVVIFEGKPLDRYRRPLTFHFFWHFQYLQEKNFAAFFHALESSKLFMYRSQGGDQRWCEHLHRYLQWFPNPKIGKKGWFYFVSPVPIDPLTSTSLSPCCFPQTYRQVWNFQMPSQALLAAIMARHEADKSNPARGQLHDNLLPIWRGTRQLLMEEVLHLLIDNWVVVSNIFYFHPYLGKIPILTNIFQRGWNHQLDT